MTNKLMTLDEAKHLLGLPATPHGLNDEGHRLLGSAEAVEHFKSKFSGAQRKPVENPNCDPTSKAPLDPDLHKDCLGERAPLHLIGKSFRHVRRNKVYEVIGFCWIGDLDQWGVTYSAVGDVVYVRSTENFTGFHEAEDGTLTPRFEAV